MTQQVALNSLSTLENRLCPGCKQSAADGCGGFVVAFGQSFFHVDCFKCAKCHQQVTADTNLLLLSDGSPICVNCSYNCNVCHQPILDEAIMTGDDSYHAHCFNCKACRNRIDEVLFAKTRHGIYCMSCHNERMTRLRRRAQQKREREKVADGSGSSSTRERDAREFLGETLVSGQSPSFSPSSSLRSKVSATTFRETPSMASLNQSREDALSTLVRKQKSPPRQDEASQTLPKNDVMSPAIPRSVHHDLPVPSHSSHDAQVQSFSVTIAPPDNSNGSIQDPCKVLINDDLGSCSQLSSRSATQGQDDSMTSFTPQLSQGGAGGSLLTPSSATGSSSMLSRRKSYDDGVRPLDILFSKKGNMKDDLRDNSSLGVSNDSMSRSEKRRSINPGLALDYKSLSRPLTASGHSSPEPIIRSHTAPVNRSDSPVAPSSSKPYFSDAFPTRRASNTSLLHDNASSSTIYLSPPPSPAPPEIGRTTSDNRMRTILHDPHQPQSAPPYTRPASPLRPTIGKVPSRSDGLDNRNNLVNIKAQYSNGRLSPGSSNETTLHTDNIPNGSMPDRAGAVTPTSPSHRADVPHGIESGTDTEAEGDNSHGSENDSIIPAPPVPPKEHRAKARENGLKLDIGSDTTALSQVDSNSDESSPVERTSISTFIAPSILPPIRLSMTGSDFSDFLKSMGGMPSLKSLDQIAEGELFPGSETLPSSGSAIGVDSIDMTVTPDIPAVSQCLDDRQSDTTDSSQLLKPFDAEAKDQVSSLSGDFSSGSGHSSESHFLSPCGPGSSGRDKDLSAPSNVFPSNARIVVTSPGSTSSMPISSDSYDLVIRRLREGFEASERGCQQPNLDKNFVETIIMLMEQRQAEYATLNNKYEETKRSSHQYVEGLTVAQKEHDRELVARRNAEAEVTRLRVLLSGQAAKLTALSGEANRSEARRQLSQDLTKRLDRLERDLSQLKAERDIAMAELEELCASKNVTDSGEMPTAKISRSLTMRLDNIKTRYQQELVPLTQQREVLIREVAELKATREHFLEETTVLNARNEELAQLSAQYVRRIEASRSATPTMVVGSRGESALDLAREKRSASFDRDRAQPDLPSTTSSAQNFAAPSTSTLGEELENKAVKANRPEVADALPSTLKSAKFKWPMAKGRDPSLSSIDPKAGSRVPHSFHQSSVLRFTRCDHCGDKLWGSQYRCSVCQISVHPRCLNQVHLTCSQRPPRHRDDTHHLPPSMFGRDLIEQVKSDSKLGGRKVPIIVEKCIDAVDALALDYEGIYRKTGGTGQTKMITQLFEQGDYMAFDLRDSDRFNDICSVTSVLKTYFRQLPVPLLTYDLHGEFISAANLKDPTLKRKHLQELVDRLPSEHYHTLRLLVLHLHRVLEHSDINLMNARNLGLVFGPTLMRSPDPSSEFSDMAGTALMIEWLVDNATFVFQSQTSR